MSHTVARNPAPAALAARNAISPVPPATVEQCERPVAARRIERVDHQLFPDPVQARRHQIVHQVVALCDAVKHLVHQRLLVPQGHVPEAEMRGLVRPIHHFTPSNLQRPDHSAPAAMSLSRQRHKVNEAAMPELPEVETVRRGLQPVMEGFSIVKAEARRKDLRFPFQKDFVARLTGQTVTGLGRRAKYLMADLASGDVLLMHLGMSGSFRVIKDEDERAPGQFHHPRSSDGAHDHVVFHMSSRAAIVFNDPRRFGYMKIIARNALEQEPLLRGLGPEPLGNEFDAAMLARSCANKKTSLKAALLDQRVVAGLGNIYVCEALFRSHLSPRRLAATLATKKGEPTDHAKRLVTAIHAVLKSGNQGRRLLAARSPPDFRRTRLFPALVSGLRSRRREMPDGRLRRHRPAIYPERAFDLLVPEVPEVSLPRLAQQVILARYALSFRDGPKDQTRNLEIPGSRFRAPRNDESTRDRV